MVNPFDPKTVFLAKHAQHVVLIHFPIALFITAVTFDFIALWTKRQGLADAAYYNLLMATISTVPVVATGLLAWQFQLEGQKLKGILLLHVLMACLSTLMIWLVWWVHFRARRRTVTLPIYRLALEVLAVAVVAVTASGRFSKRRKRTRLGIPIRSADAFTLSRAACCTRVTRLLDGLSPRRHCSRSDKQQTIAKKLH